MSMTKKEKQAMIAMMAGGKAPRKARKGRNKTRPAQKSVVIVNGPARKAPRKRRARNGGTISRKFQNNAVTTGGNMREFVIPINEQVQIISGTTGFGISTFAINPGNPSCFPFASRTAQNYERYEFQDLRFEYKPSASVFATVGAQGFVGITGTMDALQATPSSQQQAEVMLHSPIVETARPTGLSLPKPFLLTKSQREKFFVRPNGSIPGGADAHLYDCGQVFIWTNGQANTNQIGELRVIGSCKLSNPVLETSTTPPPQFQVAQFSQAATVSALVTTVSLPLPLATVTANGLGVTNNAGTFTLPVGNYNVSGEIDFIASGNSTIFTANLQKNGVSNLDVNSYSLPSGAYPLWTVPIAPNFVTSNGTDTFQLIAQSTFSTGATTAGGFLNFTSI